MDVQLGVGRDTEDGGVELGKLGEGGVEGEDPEEGEGGRSGSQRVSSRAE